MDRSFAASLHSLHTSLTGCCSEGLLVSDPMAVCPRRTSQVVLSRQNSSACSAAVQDVEKLQFKSILDEQQNIAVRRELAVAKDHADVLKDMLDGAQVRLAACRHIRYEQATGSEAWFVHTPTIWYWMIGLISHRQPHGLSTFSMKQCLSYCACVNKLSWCLTQHLRYDNNLGVPPGREEKSYTISQ